MITWRERLTRALTWRGALPARMGLDRIYVHLSAMITIPVTALIIGAMTVSAPEYVELKTAVVTLPTVWILSLAIRVAAQMLAIGSHGDDFEMIVGPAGNISNDYQQLSGPAMLSYAVAGQSATMLLTLFGLLILGSMAPVPATGLTLPEIFDFKTGWESTAWASQIFWVNLFLFVLHLLPASPFDTRALVVGWCRVSHPNMSDSRVHRLLASTNSHIAVALAGFALAMIIAHLPSMDSVLVWYALLFIAIYLLTVSQFEAYQSMRVDEDLESLDIPGWMSREFLEPGSVNYSSRYAKDMQGTGTYLNPADSPAIAETIDIDEILRKLHREGQDSLSAEEKEALLSASRELQARRQQRD